MSKIKVMIVDDHLIVREGLRQLLQLDEDIEVVSEASNGMECLNFVDASSPDIVFMDVKMPGISGIDTTRLIREKHPNVKVIMLTMHDDDKLVTSAIRAGASGYVLKNTTRHELVRAMHHVMIGQAFLDPGVTSPILEEIKQKKSSSYLDKEISLTRRELEVLQAIVSGLTDRQTAEVLHLSEHTVRSHTKSIYRKLGVSSRSQAAVQAVRQGIIDYNASPRNQ